MGQPDNEFNQTDPWVSQAHPEEDELQQPVVVSAHCVVLTLNKEVSVTCGI